MEQPLAKGRQKLWDKCLSFLSSHQVAGSETYIIGVPHQVTMSYWWSTLSSVLPSFCFSLRHCLCCALWTHSKGTTPNQPSSQASWGGILAKEGSYLSGVQQKRASDSSQSNSSAEIHWAWLRVEWNSTVTLYEGWDFCVCVFGMLDIGKAGAVIFLSQTLASD